MQRETVKKNLLLKKLSRELDERIAEIKQANEALGNAHWQLESIIGATHVGTWIWNVQTEGTVFNEMWAQIIGYPIAELAPSASRQGKHTHTEDLKHFAELLARHFADERPFYECECQVKHKDGHLVLVHDRG